MDWQLVASYFTVESTDILQCYGYAIASLLTVQAQIRFRSVMKLSDHDLQYLSLNG